MRSGKNYQAFFTTKTDRIERTVCAVFIIFCVVKLILEAFKLF